MKLNLLAVTTIYVLMTYSCFAITDNRCKLPPTNGGRTCIENLTNSDIINKFKLANIPVSIKDLADDSVILYRLKSLHESETGYPISQSIYFEYTLDNYIYFYKATNTNKKNYFNWEKSYKDFSYLCKSSNYWVEITLDLVITLYVAVLDANKGNNLRAMEDFKILEVGLLPYTKPSKARFQYFHKVYHFFSSKLSASVSDSNERETYIRSFVYLFHQHGFNLSLSIRQLTAQWDRIHSITHNNSKTLLYFYIILKSILSNNNLDSHLAAQTDAFIKYYKTGGTVQSVLSLLKDSKMEQDMPAFIMDKLHSLK